MIDDVPTTPAAVIPAVPTSPCPRMPMHDADVAVVQLLVAQLACASTAVNVSYAGAKLMPVSVTLTETEAVLYGDDTVRTGA